LTEFLVLLCAFIAGAGLYFALRQDIEQALSIGIEKNIWFPLLILLMVGSGVYMTQYVHLSESAGRASNAQQNVMVMGCILENPTDCQNNANNLNNISYNKLQSGTVQRADFYIPFSLQSSIINNAFSYFCLGILLIWGIIFGSNLQVKK